MEILVVVVLELTNVRNIESVAWLVAGVLHQRLQVPKSLLGWFCDMM